MTTRLLDTNIVSYMFKGSPIARRYRRHLHGVDLAISFQTVAELRFWGWSANWGTRRWRDLEAHPQRFIVYESDPVIASHWAKVRYERRHRMIETADAWIAATALAYQLELVTHNPADFAGIAGLAVVSEPP